MNPRHSVQNVLTIVSAITLIIVLWNPSLVGTSVEFRNGFLAGMLVLAFLAALIFPDKWVEWWGKIENTPYWLFPFFLIALLIGALNFGSAIWAALSVVKIAQWVWIAFIGGLIGAVITGALIYRRGHP